MAEENEYKKNLTEALKIRADWLEESELPKLKEEFRSFHTGFASLYNLYVKKRLINEDPYKQEAKINELSVPNTTPFHEAEKLDQLTIRLSDYDNQLDYLVNFYQFSVEFLTMDRIKLILGLIKYIDWVRLTPDATNPITKAVAEMTNQIKLGSDPLTMSVIGESLSRINKAYGLIMGNLKALTEYQKEAFKLDLRDVTEGITEADASNMPLLKKKFAQARPGRPFYPDLADEVLKEDFSQDGPGLQAAVLKKLHVADVKPKTVKVQISFKSILIEGIYGFGGMAQILTEIALKMDENQAILQSKKQSFIEKLRKVLKQAFNKEPEAVLYDLEYMDPVKGIPVREKINYALFRSDLERKIRTLNPLASRGAATTKLESMQEEQLVGFLERNVKDLQSLHKTLSALDDFFKAEVERESRDRIKGIKPELGSIKNAILRANAKRHEYGFKKEEEEQLKRLGVQPET